MKTLIWLKDIIGCSLFVILPFSLAHILAVGFWLFVIGGALKGWSE